MACALMEMTPHTLAGLCKQHDLYRTPHLNDKLYANFQGFTKIAGLDKYTGLRAIFLEGNALTSVEGLPQLQELKCLFLQNNRIQKLTSLSHLPALNTLNLNNNEIRDILGLSSCSIETLLCAHNQLGSVAAIAHLTEMTSLQTLDLQNNLLDDAAILDVLRAMPQLKCLYLKGNPVVSKIPHYRKALIAALPELTYLDDRPVFPNERETTEAWAQGGVEAEREARDNIRERERAQDRRNFEFMQALRAEGFRQKRQAQGLRDGDTDPMLDDMSDDEWQAPEDPPELVEARRKLDQCLSDQGNEDEGSEVIAASTADPDSRAHAQAIGEVQNEAGTQSKGSAGIEHNHLQPTLADAAEQLNSVRVSENAELTTSAQPA